MVLHLEPKDPGFRLGVIFHNLIKRFRDSYGSHFFDRLTTLKQEEQIETKTRIEKKGDFHNVLEIEDQHFLAETHMLRKILNEVADYENSMDGSGSDCCEAESSSWTAKVELPTFDGGTKWGTNLKGSNFESDGDRLQFLK